MPASYRIAGRMSKSDLTLVATESQFARCVQEIFSRVRPSKVIETGTYHGTGTTSIIASAIRDLKIDDAKFISIEVNPKNLAKAQVNLANAALSVDLRNGLSVPREMLPTMEQIEAELVRNVVKDGLIVDHEEATRAKLYFGETDFSSLEDDLLGKAIAEFDGKPDFVLLDSGGHMGFVEFQYLLSQLRGTCYVALDDIYHVKHFRSFQAISQDPRFELVAASEEKFGFCIARFSPGGSVDR